MLFALVESRPVRIGQPQSTSARIDSRDRDLRGCTFAMSSGIADFIKLQEIKVITGRLPQVEGFMRQIRTCFSNHTSDYHLVRIARNDPVYVAGQEDQSVYFVQMGRVKLLVPSPEYRDYWFAVRQPGDLFGELCLAGSTERQQTAVAMEDCCLKKFSAGSFLARLRNDGLVEGLVQYLTLRLAEQEEVMATLATLKSEKRLAWTLIHLGNVFGQLDANGTRITRRISQEELAEMVGTTRTRIGVFLKEFQELGLVGWSAEHWLVIDNARLKSYLNHRYGDAQERTRQSRGGSRNGASNDEAEIPCMNPAI